MQRRGRRGVAESAERSAPARSSTLQVGRVADPAEAQADRFAEELLGDLTARPVSLQRSSSGAHDELGGTAVDATVATRIRRSSGGRPLDDTIRRAAESRSGRDLSGVRLHTDRHAAALSSELQATAFTVGSNVFLGSDAPRPGTASGDALIGHELGHVVQQGGGVARSTDATLQRLPTLAALRPTSQPTVQRLFGSKKKKPSPLEQVNASVEQSKAAKVVTVNDLETQIAVLESALKTLLKQHVRGNTATQSAAFGLKSAAERILGNLPDQKSKASAVLGRTYPDKVKRLDRIIGETQLIWDEHLVEMSKRKAGNVYLGAGQQAGTAAPGATGPKGLTKLTARARGLAFDQLGDRPDTIDPTPPKFGNKTPEELLEAKQAGFDFKKSIRDNGAALGLSAAELAAIVTFTAEDYRYINPATANSRDWMVGANEADDKVDKKNRTETEDIELQQSLVAAGLTMQQRLAERKGELDELTSEGALHAGMATQGLLKLPVWKGTLYRGEVLNQTDFDSRFKADRHGTKFTATTPTMRRTNISSASKDRAKAEKFWGIAGSKVKPPRVNVLYEMEATNGRDIEMLSASRNEKEVATLPGAEFKIVSVEKQANRSILVKCKQRR